MDAREIVVVAPRAVTLEAFTVDSDDLLANEVLIRTRRTLISPGTEGAIFTNLKPAWATADASFPRKLGYANVGEVVAAGSKAKVAVGDVVFTTGRHASHVRVDTASQLCVKVPASVSAEDAVFARLATVPMSTLRTTPARLADRAAVVGLGLVGNLAAQLCEAAGLPVTAIDLDPFRCEIAKRCGISTVLVGPTDGELLSEHRLVIEATGTNEGTLSALKLARTGGEVSLVGTPWGIGNPSIPAQALLERVFSGYITLRSGWEWQLPILETTHGPGSIEQNTRHALELIRRGVLHVQELVTHRVPPSAAQSVFEGLVDRKGEYLGVVFEWSD
jgi:2-desacetyl-2-hydroxyethyl bacteriochlorophyllide A dehydrogenase